MSKPALDLVAHDCAAHGLAHHETDQWRSVPRDFQMQDEGGATGARSALDRDGEILTPPHAGLL
ncbi:hypothetical protein GCM10010412_055820 [Nonomuraea recticatena]|uniref:Uncharacterized protein n=1 Tax=Nonomuraea recticatena TaxID=46178 RepID=A0ABN3SDM8_9ACTN